MRGPIASLGSRRHANKASGGVDLDALFKICFLAIVAVILVGYWYFFQQLHNEQPIGTSSTSIEAIKSLSDSYESVAEIGMKMKKRGENKEYFHSSTSTAVKNIPDPNDSHAQLTLPRVMAIYFPQYHREPLNDRLWGDGFTDWDNLRKSPAKNRLGLAIPRPTELGYYDLEHDADVRKKQGELARQHGIDGFAYHHYWFHDPKVRPGRPNLHRPLMAMLKDGYPDMPFYLNWCNHHWSNTWSGALTPKIKNTGYDNNMLQQQFLPRNMTLVDEHYDWLRQFFHHPNYIKVQGGRPVFMVYHWKPGLIDIFKHFQMRARADGFPNGMYFMASRTQTHDELFVSGRKQGQRRNPFPRGLVDQTVAYPQPLEQMERQILKVPDWCSNERREAIHQVVGILSSFDNTPRRTVESAHLWSPDPPEEVLERFETSLRAAVHYETCCVKKSRSVTGGGGEGSMADQGDDKFIVINAWNEWAEGMALEPSDVYGRRFLEAIRTVKETLDCGK